MGASELLPYIEVTTTKIPSLDELMPELIVKPKKDDQLFIGELTSALSLPLVDETLFLNYFRWHDPLTNAQLDLIYPHKLRSFVPVPGITSLEADIAIKCIQQCGPFVPHIPSYYQDAPLNRLIEARKHVSLREVPKHQGRGYRHQGVYVFKSPSGCQVKFTTCTKGSGTSGYWEEKRAKEMIDALKKHTELYPLNPDPFHARDYTGKSRGQKGGDEVVWVGCASLSVTTREVEGFDLYQQARIYSPNCLPVIEITELPTATGDFIDTKRFTSNFDLRERLVVLGKAWALESRIWGNHFSHKNMTAAHLLSAKEDGKWLYEQILSDLTITAKKRKDDLLIDEKNIQRIISAVAPCNWEKIFGHASLMLQSIVDSLVQNRIRQIIPLIMSANLIENSARAGAFRLWGKPVAWHLENIGRLGEVSGGERIYGMASGTPNAFEIHSLFSYIFDSYMAVAIEWSVSGKHYYSIDKYFQIVRDRILELNPEHWITRCKNMDQFVIFCQQYRPEYEVKFRSEDAFPLAIVPGTTDVSCIAGDWKNWPVLKQNMITFINGVRTTYNPL